MRPSRRQRRRHTPARKRHSSARLIGGRRTRSHTQPSETCTPRRCLAARRRCLPNPLHRRSLPGNIPTQRAAIEPRMTIFPWCFPPGVPPQTRRSGRGTSVTNPPIRFSLEGRTLSARERVGQPLVAHGNDVSNILFTTGRASASRHAETGRVNPSTTRSVRCVVRCPEGAHEHALDVVDAREACAPLPPRASPAPERMSQTRSNAHLESLSCRTHALSHASGQLCLTSEPLHQRSEPLWQTSDPLCTTSEPLKSTSGARRETSAPRRRLPSA